MENQRRKIFISWFLYYLIGAILGLTLIFVLMLAMDDPIAGKGLSCLIYEWFCYLKILPMGLLVISFFTPMGWGGIVSLIATLKTGNKKLLFIAGLSGLIFGFLWPSIWSV